MRLIDIMDIVSIQIHIQRNIRPAVFMSITNSVGVCVVVDHTVDLIVSEDVRKIDCLRR